MAEGKSFHKALDMADRIEQRERSKSYLLRNRLKRKSHKKIPNELRKSLLKKYSKKIKVWIVNGELVRDLFFVDFTEGGHGYVYPFIPHDEIWIDDDVNPRERKVILLHELHERNLMSQGWCYHLEHKKSLVYHYGKRKLVLSHYHPVSRNKQRVLKSAHRASSALEYFYRRNPQKIDERLKEEIER